MIPMSAVDLSTVQGVTVLAGGPRVARDPLAVFSDEACSFLSELSKRIMGLGATRVFPDVASFAYWCRRGNLARLAREREGAFPPLSERMGRGLSLHIAPSNVPVNFAFSYAFALLAGDACIVRVPSKPFGQVEVIVEAARKTLPEYPAIAARTAFATWDSSCGATEALSSLADVRVVWGGDATVRSIRSMDAMPRCVDVVFPDRYSIALIGVEAVLSAEDGEMADLASGFYNDTYLMDQNACSSPRLVVWVGSEEDAAAAQERFWDAVRVEAEARYALQPSVSMDKYVMACADLARGTVSRVSGACGVLATADLASGQRLTTDLRGVGGYFYQTAVGGFDEIAGDVDERFQTVVCYGVDPESVRRCVRELGLRGIDRIVPVGSAMDIGLIWDGYDLIAAMSRVIEAR